MNRDYFKRRNRNPSTSHRNIIRNSAVSSTWNPEFYVQSEVTDFTESIWTLTNVHPKVFVDCRIVNATWTPPGYPTRVNNITGCAQMCADWIEWFSSGINRDTDRTMTKYSFHLEAYGYPDGGNFPTLFENTNDRFIPGVPGPWCATGIKTCGDQTYKFVNLFKAELNSRSLPHPTRLDMDVETFPNVTGILGLLADPRASINLIDGRATLSGYWAFNSGKLPNGTGVSENLDGQFDWEYNWWAGNVMSLIRDYALQEACYKYFVSGFPNIRTSNFEDACGTLTNPGYHDFRFHNTKYFVSGLYATDQGPYNYRRDFLDLNQSNFTAALYGTYDNCIYFYNVTATGNANDAVREMYINKARFQIDSCYLANPNKPIMVWHEHVPTGAIAFSDSYVPGGASYAINSGTLLAQFQKYGLSRVDTILIFSPDLPLTNDDYYYAITNLAGFHDTVSEVQSAGFPIKGGGTIGIGIV